MDEQWKQYYDLIKAETDRNNAWSAAQAQKAMDYQTEMSNSAHQREVADLKAAGLNPVLSAGGSGATTGSGLAASASNENVSALYGLAKQAIDANMKQAEEMANAAKYISSAFTSHPFSVSPNTNANVDEDFISPSPYRNPFDVSEDNPAHSSVVGDILKNVLVAFLGKQKAEGVYNALIGISRWTAIHSGGDYNNDGQISETEFKNWKGIMSFLLDQVPRNMNTPLNVLHPENTRHGYEGGYNPYKLVELGILSPEDIYNKKSKKQGSGKFRVYQTKK